MADFYELWKSQSSVIEELQGRLAEAADSAPKERESAVRISRLFRGAFVRETISIQRAACIQITRLFRAHLARRAFRAKVAARDEFEGRAVFHYHAVAIQRVYRGFFSRKHYHDAAARKKRIDSIEAKGNELRAQLRVYHEAQMREKAAADEAKARAEFEEVTRNLHHLVSTKTVAGIYNSPYNLDGPVTVGGIPVEEHIKTGVQSLLRQRGVAKRGLEADQFGSRRVPLKPPLSRLSIQATSQYDVVGQEEKLQKKLSKFKYTGIRDFAAGHKAHEMPYRRGVNEGAPFCDPWRNPYLKRGVPVNQAELGYGRTTIGAPPAVPFHTAVGGNMSSAHPNGLFDAIADAELSGGVCHRHKGRGGRFGVPDHADARGVAEPLLPALGRGRRPGEPALDAGGDGGGGDAANFMGGAFPEFGGGAGAGGRGGKPPRRGGQGGGGGGGDPNNPAYATAAVRESMSAGSGSQRRLKFDDSAAGGRFPSR